MTTDDLLAEMSRLLERGMRPRAVYADDEHIAELIADVGQTTTPTYNRTGDPPPMAPGVVFNYAGVDVYRSDTPGWRLEGEQDGFSIS